MIKINSLSKKYGKKIVLNNISINFDDGVYAILGTNGAGKTTLMSCIAGMIRYKGNIEISENYNIGYLPQVSAVFPNLTVYENLEFYAELKHISKSGRATDIEKAISLVNLDEYTQTKGNKLSGGMKRRVGIAEALLGQPEILLLDEPTVGLDPEERLRFKRTIHSIKNNHIIILSTHIVEDVEAVADNIIILNEGKIRNSGSFDDIKGIATGKVFEVPRKYVTNDDYVVHEKDGAEGIISRVLTNVPKDAVYSVDSTIEDGYLCSIKGI